MGVLDYSYRHHVNSCSATNWENVCVKDYERTVPPPGFVERLKEAMAFRGIRPDSPTQLGRRLGRDRRVCSKWLNGLTPNLSADDLFQLADGLDVSPRWLWLNQGTMTRDRTRSVDEQELLAVYRELERAPNRWAANALIERGRELKNEITLPPSRETPFPAKPRRRP